MFETHTIETAPQGSKPTLEAVTKNYGFLPNLAATLAEAPVAINSYITLAGLFSGKDTTLTAKEQQVVLLSASFENGCNYCLAAHGTIASGVGLSREDILALQKNQPLADERLEALRLFTAVIVEKRGWASEDDINAFLGAGFSKAQVLEVIIGVSLKTISNYTNHVAHTDLDPQFAGFKVEQAAAE